MSLNLRRRELFQMGTAFFAACVGLLPFKSQAAKAVTLAAEREPPQQWTKYVYDASGQRLSVQVASGPSPDIQTTSSGSYVGCVSPEPVCTYYLTE